MIHTDLTDIDQMILTLLELESPKMIQLFVLTTIIGQIQVVQHSNLCQAEDGRVLQGRVGASRPRVNVQPYTPADDDEDGDDVMTVPCDHGC